MVKYAEALSRKDYPIALVYIDECIRVNDYASSNNHIIANSLELYEKKAELLKAQSKNEEAADMYLKAAKTCREKTKAIKYAIEACSLLPNESNLCSLAAAYVDAGYTDKSLDLCNSLLEETTNDVTKCFLYKLKGDIMSNAKKYNEAIALYEKVIMLEPDNVDNHNIVAFFKYKSGDMNGAIEKWVEILTRFNMNEYMRADYESSIWITKYYIALRQNDLSSIKESKKMIKKLSRLRPENKVILKNMPR